MVADNMNTPNQFEKIAENIKIKSNNPKTTTENVTGVKFGNSKNSTQVSDYINDLEHYAKNASNADLDSDKREQIVIFRLANDYYAFYGSNIKEIRHYENLYFVPGVPETILGIINVRGDVDSVIDLSNILGVKASQQSAESRILIARSGKYQCGLLIDSLLDVTEIPTTQINEVSTALKRSFKDYIIGEFTYNQEVTFLLNIERIITRVII